MDNVTFSDNTNECIDHLVDSREFGLNREQVIITLVHDALLYNDKMRCIIKRMLLKGYSDEMIRSILPGGDAKKKYLLKEQHNLLDDIISKQDKSQKIKEQEKSEQTE